MRSRLDIKTKLQPLLYAVGTSTYFTDTRLNNAIDDAYLAVASARQWGEIKRGFVTSTIATQEYYDYPNNCQSESIFRVSVDGDAKYKKMDFEDFLKITEDTTNPRNEKIFSEFGRQIFLYPIPSASGLANLVFWGVIQAAPLLNDGDVTMFTDWSDVLNEAVMQYAYGDLIQGFDQVTSKTSTTLSQLAIAKGDRIIIQEFKKISDRLQRKLKDSPQFLVPDFFSTNQTLIGEFRINQ